ncbi:predicted protein [Paramuricea clavata]|uniref:Uncharacterized protein n=1 Tax=Paramuricea clavata TaxID=317549 RepID=A0A6S7K5F7_PARCT|nr:predicted protein [Paramuricea clavata]
MAGVRENCHKVYCFPIYPREDGHITEINALNNKNLGSRAQLCAAFYHVYNSPCLDDNCIVENQPRKVVALVKFEDAREDLVYQARYTNCYVNKNHAENFFDCDIRHGVLTAKTNQSCCDILKRIYYDILQPKRIRLRIKITHALRLERQQRGDNEEQLHKNARAGIQELIQSGITVSGMEENDWKYLFSMMDDEDGPKDDEDEPKDNENEPTDDEDDKDDPKYNEQRQYLDSEIRETLTYIF